MGRARRPHPKRLAPKLLEIRLSLGFTQQRMTECLGGERSPLRTGHISEFESGKREPSLQILLGYARLAGVPLEMIVDDELDLPIQSARRLPQTAIKGGAPAARAERP
jgi:transcriptional regulator with XRE-family HTH domain